MQPKTQEPNTRSLRRLFWVSAAFYALIAFEFFYMFSPFAAYFYAVYGPGLDWLQQIGLTHWTLWFFLPHVVSDTRSPVIDALTAIGLVLLFGGILAFLIGAVQVYRAKLRRSDAVMKGLYRYIRHPQYLALIIASIGMLLVWPRFLVLFSTILVIFIYVGLARAEEAICLKQYPSYAAYRERTGGFLPRGLWPFHLPPIGNPWLRAGAWLAVFIAVVMVSTLAALGVRYVAIQSLHAFETPDGIYLSVADMPDGQLEQVASVARDAEGVTDALDVLRGGRFLAYVLPTEMYVSEIPMDLPAGGQFGHSVPHDRDPDRYKVIFTEPEFGAGTPQSPGILWQAVNKRALIEVHVDLATSGAERVLPPPEDPFYDGNQVPLF